MGRRLRDFATGVIAAGVAFVVLAACQAAPKFPYRHYGAVTHIEEFPDGSKAVILDRLEANTEANDKGAETCVPSDNDKRPCVVMYRETFFNLKESYLQGMDDLMRCQRGY